MRVRLFSALGLTALLALGAVPAGAQTIANCKVAYLNGRAVLEATPGYLGADSTFRREMQGFENELIRAQAALDSAASKYEAGAMMLSATNRQAELKKLDDQRNAIDRRRGEIQQKALERRGQLLAPIEERVTAVIEGIRAEQNCGMIFDVATEGHGILAADKSLDLTQRVIDRMKTAGATPPAAPKGKP